MGDKEVLFGGRQWRKAQEQYTYVRTGIANGDPWNLGESDCFTIARTASLDRFGNKHIA